MDEKPPKRRLPIDLDELAAALDDNSWEHHYYLDLTSGKVILVTDEMRLDLELIYEEALDEHGQERVPIGEAIEQAEVPDWEKPTLLVADGIQRGSIKHYREIPRPEPHDSYRAMEEFIDTVQDDHLRRSLSQAITGKGAFRRFKNQLMRYPREMERWYDFKDARLEEQMNAWLAEAGLEWVEDSGA
jgi:hypothetical protein